MTVAQGSPLDDPTEGPLTPYPRKPGEPKSGYVPTPTAFATYAVPSLTPVPAGADSDFGTNPTPAVGYTAVPTPLPSDPLDIGALVYHVSNPTMHTISSANVVSGTISEVDSARWSTKDNTRPADPRASSNRDVIFRPVLVAVDSYLKGSGASTLMIMALGGAVGADTTTWGDSQYTFNVGDHVILFLNNPGLGHSLSVNGYSPWFVIEDYKIDGAGNATNVNGSIPLQDLLNSVSAAKGTKPSHP